MSEMELTESIGKPERPPLRYRGGKWRLGEWIIGYFPRHETYCEPFAGGASVFFLKAPSIFEILNDLDGDVVAFFQMLRERPEELVRAIELTPYSRLEHQNSYLPSDDPLEQARRLFIRCHMGRGSSNRKSGFRLQTGAYGWGKNVTREFSTIDHLLIAAKRLKNAQIEQREAIDLIQTCHHPNTLFYVDPPYLGSTRPGILYGCEMMDEESHRQLAEVLHGLEGMVILSGGDSELYKELYKDWRLETREALGEQHKRYIECLWISPNAQKNHGQQEMEL